MRVVKDTINVELSVSASELLQGQYISFDLLSKKIRKFEVDSNGKYYGLRYKLYNADGLGKLNTKIISGIKFVDVLNPMKGKAALELSFKKDFI